KPHGLLGQRANIEKHGAIFRSLKPRFVQGSLPARRLLFGRRPLVVELKISETTAANTQSRFIVKPIPPARARRTIEVCNARGRRTPVQITVWLDPFGQRPHERPTGRKAPV